MSAINRDPPQTSRDPVCGNRNDRFSCLFQREVEGLGDSAGYDLPGACNIQPATRDRPIGVDQPEYDQCVREGRVGAAARVADGTGVRASAFRSDLEDFDRRFLKDLTANPQRLIDLPHIDYVREAGAEGIEMVMWLIMRGALNDEVEEVYRHYHVPASNTATGLIILENRP